MKFIIAFALVAAVAALPVEDKDAQVLRSVADNIGLEGYNFSYETSNGLKADEQAVLKNTGTENEAIEVRGQFSYPGPDGVLYTVTYIANENGFQPSAAHLPVAPSV